MHKYIPEQDYEEECKCCEEKRNVIYDAAESLEELVKRLYITDQTDITKIQIALDNLCYCLGVRTIDGDINVEKKKPNFIEEWVVQNNAYLKKLANKQKEKKYA